MQNHLKLLPLISQLSVETLRNHNNQHIIVDLIICIKTGVSIHSWLEDIYEAEEGTYPYTPEEANQILVELHLL